MRIRKNKYWLMVMPATLLVFAFAARAEKPESLNPPQGIFHDQYYSIYQGTTKCGWIWSRMERQKDQIVSRNIFFMKIGRGDLTVTVQNRLQTVETLDGRPLSFFYQGDMLGGKTVYQGRFDRSSVLFKMQRGDQTSERTIEVPADTVMNWGNLLKMRPYLDQPGSTFQVHFFSPELGPIKVTPTESTVVGPDTMKIAGKTFNGIKAVTRSEMLNDLPVTSLVDPSGNLLASDMSIGIMSFQIASTSKEEALAGITSTDIFTASFIHLPAPLPIDPDKSLKLRISSDSTDTLADLPQTPMQKVTRDKTGAIVEILAPGMKRFKTKSDRPTAVHLASSSYADLDDPKLIELAQEAAGDEKDPLKTAQSLCRFVHDYIEDKNLETPFGSAGEVARSRSGDCTEHAVLLAALARIREIPSRTVIGLGYMDKIGPHGAFGYHMWTQLWIDGQWVDMDPAWGQFQADQKHIALAVKDLSDENFFSQISALTQFIGQLTIEPVTDAEQKESK